MDDTDESRASAQRRELREGWGRLAPMARAGAGGGAGALPGDPGVGRTFAGMADAEARLGPWAALAGSGGPGGGEGGGEAGAAAEARGAWEGWGREQVQRLDAEVARLSAWVGDLEGRVMAWGTQGRLQARRLLRDAAARGGAAAASGSSGSSEGNSSGWGAAAAAAAGGGGGAPEDAAESQRLPKVTFKVSSVGIRAAGEAPPVPPPVEPDPEPEAKRARLAAPPGALPEGSVPPTAVPPPLEAPPQPVPEPLAPRRLGEGPRLAFSFGAKKSVKVAARSQAEQRKPKNLFGFVPEEEEDEDEGGGDWGRAEVPEARRPSVKRPCLSAPAAHMHTAGPTLLAA